ncbi:hypothetical protein Tco_0232115 [Tanacetum coccineum]
MRVLGDSSRGLGDSFGGLGDSSGGLGDSSGGLGDSSGGLDDTDADSNATLEPVYVKDSQTQDNSTKDDPSDRGSKLDPEGVTKGRDATMNKLNEDADPNEGFPNGGFDDDDDDRDKIGKELPHFAPSPYYMGYPYDEGLGSNPPNLKKELFKDPKISHEGEMNLSAELARPKEANHPLEKVNHSRCKEYKKYKAERDSLVLEKERLENELLEILAASKQDKESFAKGGYELTRESALTKDCTFTLGYIWYHRSGGGHELTRESALTKDCTFTPGYIWYYRFGGGYELTRESALTKDYTFTPRNVVMVYVHSATDVASHLGSGASGGERTTPKKEACSFHSFHQKDGYARIVLDERITEHAYEVGAIGYDSKLPLGENRGVRVGVYRRVTSYNFSESDTYNYLLEPTPNRVIHKDPLEELLQALLCGGLPREHSNLRPRISKEEFPRSFFSLTPLIKHLDHISLSSKTRALWELSCLLEATRQSCIRLCLVCPSCLLEAACKSLACIRLCLVCPSCLLEAACKSLACIRLCPLGQSCLHVPSTGCGPDVCEIRTSYVSRQCTSSNGDSDAPCLLRGLATPDWLLFAS